MDSGQERESGIEAQELRVNFVSRQIAERFEPGRNGFGRLISIADPGVEPALIPGWAAVLPLRFSDILRMDGSARHPKYKEGPSQEHCEMILSFGREALSKGESVLIHCEAGVSRSGAAALALEALGFGLENRGRACEANMAMLEMFSELLGRKIERPEPMTRGGIILW